MKNHTPVSRHIFVKLHTVIVDTFKKKHSHQKTVVATNKQLYGYNDHNVNQPSIAKDMEETYILKYDKINFEAKAKRGFNGRKLRDYLTNLESTANEVFINSNYLDIYLCYVDCNEISDFCVKYNIKQYEERKKSKEVLIEYVGYYCDTSDILEDFLLEVNITKKTVKTITTPTNAFYEGSVTDLSLNVSMTLIAKGKQQNRILHIILFKGLWIWQREISFLVHISILIEQVNKSVVVSFCGEKICLI